MKDKQGFIDAIDLQEVEYNLGWMAGNDAADDEFESTGTIRVSGDTKWTAIKRQLKGLWTIVQTGGKQR